MMGVKTSECFAECANAFAQGQCKRIGVLQTLLVAKGGQSVYCGHGLRNMNAFQVCATLMSRSHASMTDIMPDQISLTTTRGMKTGVWPNK